jgi:hypothetical protein
MMKTVRYKLRVYPEEGPMPSALEAPFSLVPAMEAVSLFDVVDLSWCRKMFAVPNLANAPEEEDDDRGSSRVVTPQKPSRPTTPSRILRRAPIPEAPALPILRARRGTG